MNTSLLLEVPPSRRVRPSAKAVKARQILLVVVALLILIASVGIGNGISDIRGLMDHGKSVQAKLSGKRISTNKSHDTYYLEYQYFVRDRSYTKERKAQAGEYFAANRGDPITLIYLPERPKVARFYSVSRVDLSDFEQTTGVALAFIILVFVVIALILQTTIRHQLNVLENGVAVEAEIQRISPRAANNTLVFDATFSYSFDGQPCTSSMVLTADQGRDRKPGDQAILLVLPPAPGSLHFPSNLKYAECPDLEG